MTITRAQASDLLGKALERNYEPRVRAEMPGANQHEFDGAVSFDFNTGAIGRASWVKRWRAGDWSGVRTRLALWKKAGGRVLKGLVRRREEEYQLMRFGRYNLHKTVQEGTDLALIVVAMSLPEIADMRADFKALGFDPGLSAKGVSDTAVRAFQKKHGLTVDGKIGRATLSTLQRMCDARRKSLTAGGATAGGTAAGAAAPAIEAMPFDPAALGAGGGLAWLLWTAWTYRDALAGFIGPSMPDLAQWLREL